MNAESVPSGAVIFDAGAGWIGVVETQNVVCHDNPQLMQVQSRTTYFRPGWEGVGRKQGEWKFVAYVQLFQEANAQ